MEDPLTNSLKKALITPAVLKTCITPYRETLKVSGYLDALCATNQKVRKQFHGLSLQRFWECDQKSP